MIEIAGVNLAIAFLAGLASCISPCVLPLAPIYFGNLVGSSSAEGRDSPSKPFVHAAAFMSGFLLLFIILGLSVGLIGYVLRDQLPLLQKVGGVFLILMGLHMARIFEFSWLYRGLGLEWRAGQHGSYLRSFAAGCSISAGWLPCIGPTLGSILTLALTSATVAQSAILLLVYSLGLALPFIAIGAAFMRAPAALKWFNRHHAITTSVTGSLMIITGILLFTGALQELNAYFNLSGSGLGANL